MEVSKVNIFLIEQDPKEAARIQRMVSEENEINIHGTLLELFHTGALPGGLDERAARQQIDLILLSMHLDEPQIDDALAQLNKAFPSIPVIVLNGYSSEGLALRVLQIGAADYLSKDRLDRHSLSHAIFLAIKRRQIQKQLAQSEMRYRRLAENAQDLIYRYNLAEPRGFEYVSPSATAMTGFTPEDHYADPDLGFKIVHPDDRRLLEAAGRGEIQPGQPLTLRWIKKDGSVIWTEQRNVMILDAEGRPIAIEGIARDVTGRKQAEETLRQTETFYQTILEDLPELIVRFLPDGALTYVNDEFCRFTNSKREDLIGANFFVMMGDDFPANPGEYHKRFTPDQPALQNESFQYGVNGAKRWFEWTNHAFFGEQGNLLEFQSTGYEITRRKKAEEALRESEARYRMLFESNPHPMWVYDLETLKFLAVNDTAVLNYGYSREEFLDMTLKDIRPIEEVPNLLENIATETAVYQNSTGWKHRLKDGRLIDVEITSHTLQLDGKPARLVLASDVSERIRAEQALRESETRYRGIFDGVQEAIFVESLDGDILDVNKSACEMFGYRREDLLKKKVTDLVPPGEPILVSDKNGRGGLSTLFMETINRRANGEEFAVEISGSEFQLDGNDTVLVVVRDISERKTAEKALRLQSAALEAAANAIMITDASGNIEWINPAYTHLTGYSWEEVYGKNPRILNSGKQKANVFKDLWATIRAGKVWRGELVNKRKDGSLYFEEQTVTPLLDESGNIINFIAIKQDVSARKLAEENIRRQLGRLKILHDIDRSISSSFDMQYILNKLVHYVASELKVDAANILLLDPAQTALDSAASFGFQTPALANKAAHLGIDQGLAGQTIQNRKINQIADLRETGQDTRVPAWKEEGFVGYVGIPLIAKGDAKGVLEIFHRSPLAFDQEWLDFLQMLAGQAAIAIENSQLFTNLRQSNLDLKQAYDATIEGWSRAMDLRDKETEGHTRRVTELTLELGGAMGIEEDEIVHIRRGALLHDIGKLGVPDHILLKPDQLTGDEWGIMKKHPTWAFEMIKDIPYLLPALDIPYCHHEKWDGTGYPRGLREQQIPLSARIFAVVDVWDALTSDRPYRQAWTKEKALDYIRAMAGRHFDPEVVDLFLKLGVEKGWF